MGAATEGLVARVMSSIGPKDENEQRIVDSGLEDYQSSIMERRAGVVERLALRKQSMLEAGIASDDVSIQAIERIMTKLA